jgi:hypothetical protein
MKSTTAEEKEFICKIKETAYDRLFIENKICD